MATIPAARNLAHNPRPASLTNVAAGTGITSLTLVTDRSYSGNSSILVTPSSSTGNFAIDAAAAGDADITSIAGSATINAAIHVFGPTPSGWVATLILIYTDATQTVGSSVSIDNPSLRFVRVNLPSVVKNPAKTINRIVVSVGGSGVASTPPFYVGGFDIRVNQSIDGFISGASGTNYSWEGAANNSPSNRALFITTPIVGTGGSVYPTVRLYVVNRNGAVLREITSHFIDGDIAYDLDAETWKGSCRLILDDPSLITPYALEFVRVILRLTYPDGSFEEASQGQFMVDPPSERWSSGDDQWTYQGKDLLGVLASTMPPLLAHGYSAGTSYTAAFADVCITQCGLTASQFSFPSTATLIPADITWEAGTTFLKILTDLLIAVGFQKPWVTPNGVITSAVAGTNPAAFPTSAFFATGPNSDVRWPFQVDPDLSGVANRVHIISSKHVQNLDTSSPVIHAYSPDQGNQQDSVVEAEKKKKKNKKKHNKKKGDPPSDPGGGDGGEPTPPPPEPSDGFVTVSISVANRDPSHPLSYPRLQRYIDLPPISINQVVDENDAYAQAQQALIKASQLPIIARLTTRVMLRGLNEVYELNLLDSHGNPIESGQGKYFCRGWQLQLGLPFEMVHTLKRVVDFVSTPFF